MKKNHVWRTLLTICLATCFSVPALAATQVGPAWVNGVSISELSQSNYYTGTMNPQDTATTEGAERPVLVTARSGRKGKTSTATTSAATTAAENTSTAGAASGDAAMSTMTTASSGSMIATTAAGSATDPSTALLEKQAAEQAEAAALAAQIAQEEAAASVGTRTGETSIGAVVTEESEKYTKGVSLGIFRITGYYGNGKTNSGTWPKADHTIAADTSVLPMGTKVFINHTVYTVEDIGGAVKGNLIDIYYNSYEEAFGVTALGHRFAEVFVAVPKS